MDKIFLSRFSVRRWFIEVFYFGLKIAYFSTKSTLIR